MPISIFLRWHSQDHLRSNLGVISGTCLGIICVAVSIQSVNHIVKLVKHCRKTQLFIIQSENFVMAYKLVIGRSGEFR